MEMRDMWRANFCSPICLAFGLGVVARLIRSEFSLPRDLYASLAIHLLLGLGLKGGVELTPQDGGPRLQGDPAPVSVSAGRRQKKSSKAMPL